MDALPLDKFEEDLWRYFAFEVQSPTLSITHLTSTTKCLIKGQLLERSGESGREGANRRRRHGYCFEVLLYSLLSRSQVEFDRALQLVLL